MKPYSLSFGRCASLKRSFAVALLSLCGAWVGHAQSTFAPEKESYQKIPVKSYRYRVYLANKDNNPYSVKKPLAFLSQKSIDRRKRYGLKVDKYDLPLTPKYVQEILSMGYKLHNKSKWNNTMVIETTDTTHLNAVRQLPYVDKIVKVWVSPDSVLVEDKTVLPQLVTDQEFDKDNGYYGNAQEQTYMLNVQRLHEKGYRGKDMVIAVIDGGFNNADIIPNLQGVKILGTRNFVHPDESVYRTAQQHGTMVLSCIATNRPKKMVGTAPDASFYLLQSEDGATEQLVEEDNFAAALEYADSLGVDLATASLGYTQFDYPEMNLPYRFLNGKTAVNSVAASLTASRGMILCNSAGNSGNDTWKKIGYPADATDILAVGAVRNDSINTGFSSLGYSADGRVKPDVMAMGGRSTVINKYNKITTANGTSFSCPIMAGAVTCLWQAHRHVAPQRLMEVIRSVGNHAPSPNEIFGYGIPDMWKAHLLLENK